MYFFIIFGIIVQREVFLPCGKDGMTMMAKIMKLLGTVFLILTGSAMALGFFYLVVNHDFSESPPVSVENCDNRYIVHNGRPLVTAHRFGGGIAPENTMCAFENIISSRDYFDVGCFEFDLQLTRDGQLVLLHDATLDRTSNAAEYFGAKEVKVSDYTYQELRELNMGEQFVTADARTPYQGLRGDLIPDNLRIARFEDVVEYLNQYREFNYIVEIKDKKEQGRRSCDEVYRILKENDLLENALICTFKDDLCQYLDSAFPELSRTASKREIYLFYLDSLLDIRRPEGYYPFDTLLIPDENYIMKLGTTRVVNYAHKNDIAVQYWTINDEDHVRELAAKGEDGIISDFPDMAFRVLCEYLEEVG